MQAYNYKYFFLTQFENVHYWDVNKYAQQAWNSSYDKIELQNCINEESEKYKIYENEEQEFGILGVNNKKGIFDAYLQKGKDINQAYKRMEEGWMAYNPYRINVGSIGIKQKEHSYQYISPAYVVFSCKENLLPDYLYLTFKTSIFNQYVNENTTGSVRQNLSFDTLKSLQIPLPSMSEQHRIVENYNTIINLSEEQEQQAKALEEEIEKYLCEALGIEKQQEEKWGNGKMYFVKFSFIQEWGVERVLGNNKYLSSKYNIQSFAENSELSKAIFRGKSPKYLPQSGNVIINQKCNRWNEIDLNHAKTVDTEWLNAIDKNQLTKEGDILVNSTGEGTIGRASIVTEAHANLLYDSHILLLRVNKNLIDPDFFTLVFNSFYGQQQVDSLKSAQSTNQTELGIENLRKILIPFPPFSVQKEIAKHIQSMREQIKNLRLNADKQKKSAIEEFEKEIFKQ
jgi:restriction endonuclease S subunit